MRQPCRPPEHEWSLQHHHRLHNTAYTCESGVGFEDE